MLFSVFSPKTPQHDLVPRFSIHNVFSLKEEMDATKWADILIATAKDWAVPDVIENSDTYKKFTAQSQKQVRGKHGRVRHTCVT